jgi:hypothetical protein
VPTLPVILAFNLSNGLFDGAATLAIEPYVFDLVPRNKMGTMNSGFLFIQGVLRVVVGVSVGLWVKYWSRLFCAPDRYDYSSGYLFVFLLGAGAYGIAILFERERKLGRVTEYARLEEEGVPVEMNDKGQCVPVEKLPPPDRAGR